MKKDGAAKRRRGLSNVRVVTRLNIGDAVGSNNPAEGGPAPSQRSGSRRSGDIAPFALGVGRDSATAGKRIRRILNGDPADRSSWAPPSSPKRPGFLFKGLGGWSLPRPFQLSLVPVAGGGLGITGSDQPDQLFPSNPLSPSFDLSAIAIVDSELDA